MYIGYLVIGLFSLAMLIWALSTLPKDDPSSNDDEDGGTHTGGDSYPESPPPSIVVNVPDRERTSRSSTDT